jgi:hypothetical protein
MCCYDGRKFPKMAFDRILVDAPCAGLGVVSRDPSVKFSKTYKDVVRCAVLQKELLLRAIDLCDHTSQSGGIVVYSTLLDLDRGERGGDRLRVAQARRAGARRRPLVWRRRLHALPRPSV